MDEVEMTNYEYQIISQTLEVLKRHKLKDTQEYKGLEFLLGEHSYAGE